MNIFDMSVEQIVTTARPFFFGSSKEMNNFGTFPFYTDEDSMIEQWQLKYLYTYYMQEIGQETPSQHRLYLYNRLRNVMPYYRGLYNSTLHDFDWWNNENYQLIQNLTGNKTEEIEKTKDTGQDWSDTDNNSQNSSGTTGKAFSDTPQNGLEDVDKLQYLSSYERVTQSAQNSSQGTRSGTNSQNEKGSEDRTNNYGEDKQITVKGKRGSITVSQMLKEYRDTIVNIDMMLLNEMKSLFMLIL